MRQYSRTATVLFILAFISVNGATSVRSRSLTYDEPGHLRYGIQILAGDATRFDDSKMPVSVLNALPQKLSTVLPAGRFSDWLSDAYASRLVTVGASLLLALLVFAWAKRLYGVRAGFLALILYAFDPTIIAHSQLITTDLYAGATITLAVFALWRFSRARSWTNAAFSATTLGLAQIAKYTGTHLYLLFPLLLVLHDAPYLRLLGRGMYRHRHGHKNLRKYRLRLQSYVHRSAAFAALYVLINLLVINGGFLCSGSFTPLRDYRFRSELFQGLQSRSGILASVRLPVPYPYLEGLDAVVHNERTGDGHGRVYLLGRLAEPGEGFPGYFFAAYLFKVPIAMQVLVLAALVVCVRTFSWKQFRKTELFLIGPVVFFLLYFNFFFRTQIGIRFILIIFPFLHVFVAGLAKAGLLSRRGWALVSLLVAYQAISVISYYPQYLAYFNELVPDRRMAYRVLADSNLDWNQNQLLLEEYRRDNPSTRFEPESPVAGTVVVPVNHLLGIDSAPEQFAWLRENFRPVATIGYSYLVFEVSPQRLEEITRDRRGAGAAGAGGSAKPKTGRRRGRSGR